MNDKLNEDFKNEFPRLAKIKPEDIDVEAMKKLLKDIINDEFNKEARNARRT